MRRLVLLLIGLLATLLLLTGCPAAGAGGGGDDGGEDQDAQAETTTEDETSEEDTTEEEEAASWITGFSVSVPEVVEAGRSLGTVEAAEGRTGVSYAITSQTVTGALAIDSSSGEVTVADAGAFDYESRSVVSATVEATSGDETSTASVSARLTDVILDGDNGLLAYLPLDDDEEDHSGAGRTTEIRGSLAKATDRGGEADKAREMSDGEIAISNPYEAADSFTISAWVYDDGTSTTRDRVIATKLSDTTSREFAWRLRKVGSETWQDGRLEAFFDNDGNNGVNGGGAFPTEEWVHVAITFDAGAAGDANDGTATLYRNGEAVAIAEEISLTMSGGNVSFGGESANNLDRTDTLSFSGLMDDIAIFNTALTAEQIKLLKEEDGSVIDPAELVTTEAETPVAEE